MDTMKTKQCTICGEVKELPEFYTTSNRTCKKCHVARVIENQKNKIDHYNKYRRDYAKNNPVKIKAWTEKANQKYLAENGVTYSAKYFKSLTDEQKQIRYEKHKKYCDANREAVRERGRNHYKKDREKRKAESLMRYHNNQKAKQKLIDELQLQIQSINEEN
ncbi:MAG: hypothetical protein DI538_06460 [Azospira oryzae]|jgi:hypothetical protein|nr:MAG: hypothetical protein DI538_06460 [Azospira oryzae]